MTIEEYRQNPVIIGFGVDAGPPIGPIVDIDIPVTGATIKARMYHPPDAPQDAQLPCYVNFHGGGVSLSTLNIHK